MAPRLTYPVILGRDWPDFPKVLHTANLGTPSVLMALERDTLEVECEPEEDHDLDDLGGKAVTPPHQLTRRAPAWKSILPRIRGKTPHSVYE